MSLREMIADEISDIQDYRDRAEMLEAADRILALSELADALRSTGPQAEWNRRKSIQYAAETGGQTSK